MKYFKVEALCGHVGRGKCIKKCFAIRAENRKEAASIGRFTPRVKHDLKGAILSVNEIEVSEYYDLIDANDKDPYFKIKNIQEQRMQDLHLDILIVSDLFPENNKKKGHSKVSKKAYINRYLSYDDNYYDYLLGECV